MKNPQIFNQNFYKLEDKRTIWRRLLALAEGPSSALVKLVTDGLLTMISYLDYFPSSHQI